MNKPSQNKSAAYRRACGDAGDVGQHPPIRPSAFVREIQPSAIAEVERERAAVKQAVSNTLAKYQRRPVAK